MLSSTPTPLWQVLVDLGKEADDLPDKTEAAKKKRDAAIADVKTAKAMREALDSEADKQAAAIDDAQTQEGYALPTSRRQRAARRTCRTIP